MCVPVHGPGADYDGAPGQQVHQGGQEEHGRVSKINICMYSKVMVSFHTYSISVKHGNETLHVELEKFLIPNKLSESEVFS